MNTTIQPSLFSTTPATTRTSTLTSEDAYLVAWLRSRIDPLTRTLRDDSALTVTRYDQRQIARLLKAARARGLTITAPPARRAA